MFTRILGMYNNMSADYCAGNFDFDAQIVLLQETLTVRNKTLKRMGFSEVYY